MPQMSPLWWLIFPLIMVVIAIMMVVSLFEVKMDSGKGSEFNDKYGVPMWW